MILEYDNMSQIKELQKKYSMDESVRLLFKMEDTLPMKIEEIEVLVDDKYDLKEKKHVIYFSGEEGVYLAHFLKL